MNLTFVKSITWRANNSWWNIQFLWKHTSQWWILTCCYENVFIYEDKTQSKWHLIKFNREVSSAVRKYLEALEDQGKRSHQTYIWPSTVITARAWRYMLKVTSKGLHWNSSYQVYYHRFCLFFLGFTEKLQVVQQELLMGVCADLGRRWTSLSALWVLFTSVPFHPQMLLSGTCLQIGDIPS